MNELIRELKRLPQDEATRVMIRILEKQQRDENIRLYTACEEAKGKAETNLSVAKILKENNSFFVSNWLNKRRNRKIIIVIESIYMH